MHTHSDLNERTRQRMHKLALGIVLTSQSVPFLHGGSDFARTKGGNHNSYNSGDEVNKFDWKRKAKLQSLHRFVAGLIQLRRQHAAFRLPTAAAVRQVLQWREALQGVLAYTVDGAKAGDDWEQIFVAYNGEPDAQTVSLPEGMWVIVADHSAAGTQPLGRARREVKMPSYSLLVAHKYPREESSPAAVAR